MVRMHKNISTSIQIPVGRKIREAARVEKARAAAKALKEMGR